MRDREEWKDVVGYEGLYQVSSHGRVRSLDRVYRRKDGALVPHRGRVLRPAKMTKGSRQPLGHYYLVVGLSKNARVKVHLIQTLVLEAFIGPRPLGARALHSDDDKTNNRKNNLYWGSQKDNIADAIRNGKQCIGERHPLAKSTAAEVRKIRELYATGEYAQKDLARMFARSFVWIHSVVRWKKWKHV